MRLSLVTYSFFEPPACHHGAYIGESYTGAFGQKKHCSAEGGYVGETWDGLAGETTDLFDSDSFSDPFTDE